MPERDRDARWHRWHIAAAAAAAASSAWVLALVASEGMTRALLANVGTGTAAFVAATACLLSRGRRTGRDRLAWTLFGASAACWGGGQVLWTVYEHALARELPFPSLADVGFLLALPLAAAGMLVMAHDRWWDAGGGRARLDRLLLGTAVLCVSWSLVLQPVYSAARGHGLATMIALAYPLGDTILLAIIASVAMTTPTARGEDGRVLALVAGAFAALAVADGGFAYLTSTDRYATGGIVDVGWGLGYVLLAVASTVPGAAGRPRVASARRAALGASLPSVAVLIATAIALIAIIRSGEIHVVLVVGAVAMLSVRQLLAVQENVDLADALRVRIEELHVSQQRFEALVQHSSDAVAVVDPTGTVHYASESSERVIGHTTDALVGRSLGDHLDGEGVRRLRTTLDERAAAPRTAGTVLLDLCGADGLERTVEVTVTSLLDDPAVGGLVLNMRDVSQQRLLAAQLSHQAYHDALTGLANRVLFKEQVERRLSGAAGEGEPSVLFLDLDGFKVVNDSKGHATGDALLQQVADRLRTCVRPGDLVARLGGDEFAVLVEGARSLADAEAVAARILEALSVPFTVDGSELRLTGSIGIATVSEGHAAVDELLRNADLAMYRAKATGGGVHEAFDEAMHVALVERVELEHDLSRAVDRGELVLHYQPTFEIASGRLTGVEALVRWQHPVKGLLAPGAFMPDAERTGLIVPIGRWVLEEACRQGAAWQRDLPAARELSMSVNVSGLQLRPGFAEEVAATLHASGLPSERLVLELTESTIVGSAEHIEVLHELKALGLRIAIDDFGTGYSSLGSLHRCPVDVLKIDRSFVHRVSEDPAARELIGAMVQLARSLSLTTVAEGIENEAELAELDRLSCQLGQGFHVARPAPAAEIGALLATSPLTAEPVAPAVA